MINTYKIGVAAATAADNMASIQLPRKGIIRQILINLRLVLETDCHACVQVRKNIATGSLATTANTPTFILCECAGVALLTTSGFSNAATIARTDCNEPCNERDTLYLHGSGSGANQCTVDVLVFVEEP